MPHSQVLISQIIAYSVQAAAVFQLALTVCICRCC